MGAGQLHPGEVFKHQTGIFDRHFAGQFLHARRVTGGFFQTQGGVGGHAPFTAAFAVAAGAADGDRTKARLEGARVMGGQAREGLLADRADRGCGVGPGLGRALGGLAEQCLHIGRRLDFEMPEILVVGGAEAVDRLFQRTSRARRQHRQWFRCRR